MSRLRGIGLWGRSSIPYTLLLKVSNVFFDVSNHSPLNKQELTTAALYRATLMYSALADLRDYFLSPFKLHQPASLEKETANILTVRLRLHGAHTLPWSAAYVLGRPKVQSDFVHAHCSLDGAMRHIVAGAIMNLRWTLALSLQSERSWHERLAPRREIKYHSKDFNENEIYTHELHL